MKEVSQPKKEELKYLKVKDLIVENRFRVEMGDLDSLALDIYEEGYFSTIVVEEIKVEGKKTYTVWAGGRRVAAALKHGIEELPAIIKKNLTPRARRTIELQENLCRKELTWQERDALVAEIDRMGVEESGGNGKWTREDTARIVGVHKTEVSKALERYEAVTAFPELSKCRNAREATQGVQKIKQQLMVNIAAKKLAERRDATPTDKVKKDLMDSYIVGDFLDRSRSLQKESVDFIEVDPPYAQDMDVLYNWEDKPNQVKARGSYTEWRKEDFVTNLGNALDDCFKIAKPNAWIIVWCTSYNMSITVNLLCQAGFSATERPAIWTKPSNVGRVMNPDIHLPTNYEFFIYARKGEASLQKPGTASTFPCAVPLDKVHLAQKPIALYEDILPVFCPPGAKILSPFLGSGNVLLASCNLHYNAYGFDLSETHKNEFILRVHAKEPGEYGRV